MLAGKKYIFKITQSKKKKNYTVLVFWLVWIWIKFFNLVLTLGDIYGPSI